MVNNSKKVEIKTDESQIMKSIDSTQNYDNSSQICQSSAEFEDLTSRKIVEIDKIDENLTVNILEK